MTRPNLAVIVFASIFLGACAGKQPPPRIPNTPEARAIVQVLDSYRSAMEEKDVDTILAIASRHYHDRMGTADPDDDVLYEDLEEKLSSDFEQIRRVRLDIEVLRIEMQEPLAENEAPTATVRYRYDIRYQLSMPSGEKWHNALEVNQMLLRREPDGAWRVLSGL